MESFKWGPQFFTGLTEVDDQHQVLIGMINGFGTAFAENIVDGQLLLATFQELAAYAQNHFDTEESLMHDMKLDHRYVNHHIRAHRNFVIDITNLADSSDPTCQEDYRTLFEYLIHWLAYHILGEDQRMARQVSAVKNGISPSSAYNHEKRKTNSSTEPLLEALSGLFLLVSKRNKALIEFNRTLEAKVAERTKDLIEANQALEIISITDHLTELPNRRYAMRQLKLHWQEAIRNNQPLACLMIDADGFKSVNDNYGHDAGDLVLQQLARELQHSMRSDDIVCRLGGDEFLAICPDTSAEGALHLAEQTRARIADLKVTAGRGFWLGSVSIGVAVSNAALGDTDALLKAADEAVYDAKKAGRNCVRTR